MKRGTNVNNVPFGSETGPPTMMGDNFFVPTSTNHPQWRMRPAMSRMAGPNNFQNNVLSPNFPNVVNGMNSVRHSQNSEGIQSVESSMENTDMYLQSGDINPNMLNVDISASNFMKVMKFGAAAGVNESGETDVSQAFTDNDENTIGMDEQVGVTEELSE